MTFEMSGRYDSASLNNVMCNVVKCIHAQTESAVNNLHDCHCCCSECKLCWETLRMDLNKLT